MGEAVRDWFYPGSCPGGAAFGPSGGRGRFRVGLSHRSALSFQRGVVHFQR